MSKELIASYTKKDFRVDVYRSQGPGGQGVNKIESAVRITHLPSGLVSSCQETRSQHQNKKIAFQRLSQKVLEWHKQKELKTKDRSTETIRTYHAVDNRVKDHVSGFMQTYDEVMDDMSSMIEARHTIKTDE